MKPLILIVDDERPLVETIAYNLEKAGYDTVKAFDGDSALEQARLLKPSLLVLDLMLPKVSGWEVCRLLRQDTAGFDGQILMLTARGEEADKVAGLEMGADDYMVKPFGMRELVARVRALLRRVKVENMGEGEVLRSGPVKMDTNSHEVHVTTEGNEQEVRLSLKEFELLRVLLTNAGKAVPREILLERVWGDDFFGDERTLDVHIRWLREKIEPSPSQPRHIVTVRGVGYKFKSL